MDLLKIKVKDTIERLSFKDFLDSRDIMYFAKKKSIYVKPDTENDVFSYLDTLGIDYDSKFKSEVDITSPVFEVYNATEEVLDILAKKEDTPKQGTSVLKDESEFSAAKTEFKQNSSAQTLSFDDEVLRKIDAGEALTEKEIRTLVLCGYAVEEIEHSVGRWERQVSSIVEIKNRHFSIDWSEGLTEIQENSFDDFYPEEVESYEETVVVKKWRPIEKTKEETAEETEEELEL